MSGTTSTQAANAAHAATDLVQRVQVVGVDGSAGETWAPTATPTLANVASSASSVTLFAANTAARVRILVNDSTSTLYVKFGTTASATSYTYQVGPGATLEFPQPIYNGRVDGIWASANGNARTTEIAT